MDDLKKAAKRFGSDGVIETAVEYRFSVDQVADLIEFCDEADYTIAVKAKRFPTRRRHKLTFEERAKRALGIPTTEETE